MPKGQKRAASASAKSQSNRPTKRKCDLKWKRQFSHKGPRLPSPYKRIGATFLYNRKRIIGVVLPKTEEIAVLYARYLTGKRKPKKIEERLRQNFFKDWRKGMVESERKRIVNFKLCDFSKLVAKLKQNADKKKGLSKTLKQKRLNDVKKYKTVIVDGKREQVSNYAVEPPGFYMGRGTDNVNIGRVKTRIQSKDITLNLDEKSKVQKKQWKAVVHNRSVMWLASWMDPITNRPKYIQLHPSSTIKNVCDKEKFITARRLKGKIRTIRKYYEKGVRSKDDTTRQIATATFLIDRFALRVGNEKTEEATNTVGCCSLRFEHVSFLRRKKGQKKGLEGVHLKFLGKDSIPYENNLLVSRPVHNNLQAFLKGKKKGSFIFDKIDTKHVNEYLANLMNGLTAKVFRTFRATQFFQEKLDEYSRMYLKNGKKEDVRMKVIVHKKANLAVAQLLNHQIPSKPRGKGNAIKNLERKLKATEAGIQREILKEELDIKQNLRKYALGTSKTNYIDPVITANWCKKYYVPISKVYSKTQREKFQWALRESAK